MAVEFAYRLKENGRLERVTAMFVRINSYEGRVACGVLRSMVREEPISFQGLDQMLLLMEEVLDREDVRLSALEYRIIDVRFPEDHWLEAKRDVEPKKTNGFVSQNFLIKIFGRQNRSFQGELRSGETKVYFRSGMELVRLMHQWLKGNIRQHRTEKIRNGKV